VPFEVIPAIDVAGGRLVRMSRDGAVTVEAFSGDPLAAAASYVDAGAGRMHVVDVDLADTGEAANLDVVRAIAALGVPVQASGGIRTREHVDGLLDAGAGRVVVGSAALRRRDAVEAILAAYGERVCIGIEADGSAIRPRGGGEDLPLWDTLEWLRGVAVPRFVFTEAGRSGAMSGPDLDGIWALGTHTDRPVLASGGIRNVEDLTAVAALGGRVEGAIVGRALQEGLDLAEAIRALG
jgi:phosphoribosylformimino-5-aminoimidazole carboxamide ribonucleotide (ProFAR) isomerase